MPTLLMTEAGAKPMESSQVRNFLFAHWEGGGNTSPMLSLARRLVTRGHTVRVLGDACNEEDVRSAGASFSAWTRGYRRLDKSVESDPLKDWEISSPFAQIARLRDRLFIGPSLGHAQDVIEELQRFPANVVVSSEMLLGAMAGAESAGIPCVALSANICLYPLPGVPPFGPGFLPATGVLGRLRDALVARLTLREFGKGTAMFNATRRTFGLGPLAHPFDQVKRVTKHLVLTSAAFDFPSTRLPERIVYAGPELEDPSWTAPWNSPWPAEDRRPLVLVGFSTTFQNQTLVLRRIIEAVSELEVRAVVTLGPSLDAAALRSSLGESNPRSLSAVHLCASAPHSVLLREAAAVVTHAGHGTVIRALAAGVPLVCLPMGRDQNDNAARVVARGAGVRLSPAANVQTIRQGIRDVLGSTRYRDRAVELGQRISHDARHSRAVGILEEIAAEHAVLKNG